MKKYLAEFIATFILTFTACGGASFSGGYAGYLSVVGISLLFGTIIMVLFYMFRDISGSNMNPAVSFAMLLTGKIGVTDFCAYVTAQFLGAIAAAFALYGITLSFKQDVMSQYMSYGYDLSSLGCNGYGELSTFIQVNMPGAFIIEAILTFIVVFAVLSAVSKKSLKQLSGIIIGAAFTAVHLFGVTITGTGVNPARSFGPALVKAIYGDVTPLTQVWVFIAAPLIGSAIAAGCYSIFYKNTVTKTEETQDEETRVMLEGLEVEK